MQLSRERSVALVETLRAMKANGLENDTRYQTLLRLLAAQDLDTVATATTESRPDASSPSLRPESLRFHVDAFRKIGRNIPLSKTHLQTLQVSTERGTSSDPSMTSHFLPLMF